MKNTFRLLALSAVFALPGAAAFAADIPGRVLKPTPPAASQACKETSALPTDVFGFTTGSDVNDLGALSAALEYNGNFGTRNGKLQAHLLKAQVSYSPFLCFEFGPTIQGASVGAGASSFGFDQRQFGGTVEMKYKLTGRATHGIGITVTTEPGIFNRQYRSGFADIFGNPSRPSGQVVSNLARVLIDFELVKDKLFGAINLEHSAVWDDPVSQNAGFGNPGFARFSNVNIRAALAYKVTDAFYVGVEGSHQRAYSGIFFGNDLGNAWFAGPTFFWQATDKLAITGAYNYQIAGQNENPTNALRSVSKDVDLINFNRHLAKLKLAYSF
jgi:hypothetical protein